MTKKQNQTIKMEYPNGQHLSLPGQEIEIINKEDGVVFGKWNNYMVATWGTDCNVWYTTRDHVMPKDEPRKTYTDPRLRNRSINMRV